MASWHEVLANKKAVHHAAAAELVPVKQRYVDSLRDFSQKYPAHERAREAYRTVELEFARELYSSGNFADAARFYESVLRDDPRNEQLKHELDSTLNRRFVTRETLAELRKGMLPDEVSQRIGTPVPGWQQSLQKGTRTVIGWYYPRRDGGISGVYFLDGKLFAAEYERAVPLKP